jgi:HEPN domain-containing protein
MPSTDAKINDYITRSFRDVADDDYIAARAMYRLRLDRQFLWSALQAIEKYLKAILLYHRISTKELGHNVSRALDRVRSVPTLNFKIPASTEKFIHRLGAHGIDRYFQQPVCTDRLGLLELDNAVWQLRKYCRAVSIKSDAKGPINGRLEDVLSRASRARDDLIWKNLYFGRYKKISFSRRVKWANPSNFIYPEIFSELDELIQFSKPVRGHFLRLSRRNKATAPRQRRGMMHIDYTLPSEVRVQGIATAKETEML